MCYMWFVSMSSPRGGKSGYKTNCILAIDFNYMPLYKMHMHSIGRHDVKFEICSMRLTL